MDTTTALKKAIAMLRRDFPPVGDDWPEFEFELDQLLQELDADPNNVQITRAMIMALFGSHRQALERLTKVMAKLTSATTESYNPGVDQQTGYATAPTVATRYTDIQLPARVQVGRRFAVIVGLTMTPSPDSADAQPVKAVAGQAVRVVLTPAGARVLGERVEELRVEAERDSDPAVFYLRAAREGARLGPRVLGGQPDRRHQPARVEAVIGGVRDPLWTGRPADPGRRSSRTLS